MIYFDNDPTVDAAYKNMLQRSVISRRLRVEIDGAEINSAEILADSFALKSAIMDHENLRFGGCISTRLTLQLQRVSVSGLQGKMIRIWLIQQSSGDPIYPSDTLYPSDGFMIGAPTYTNMQQLYTGYIDNIRRSNKLAAWELTAYDELYRMSQTKCKTALSNIMLYDPENINTLTKFAEKTLELYDGYYNTEFEQQLVNNRGLQYRLSPNHGKIIRDLFDTHAPDDFTVLDVLAAHSELNARFAYIAPNGDLLFTNFFVYSGLSRTEKKPVDEKINYYKNFSCEEYNSAQIKYLSFPFNGGVDRINYGATDEKRFWYIADNIITSCCNTGSDNQLIYNYWRNGTSENYVFYGMSQYRPYQLTTFGEWWIELGDRITVDYEIYNPATGNYVTEQLDSFVLERTISGISNMQVTIGARGAEYFGKEIL